MGTKRQIAPTVAEVISSTCGGPLLDIFSGICAVGSAIGPQRQVWSNDIQTFPVQIAEAFFASTEPPMYSLYAAEIVRHHYAQNKRALEKRFANELLREQKALESGHLSALATFTEMLPHVGNSTGLELERKILACSPKTFPYRLFCITFSGGFLGLWQAIQIDSIRYAVDKLLDSRSISSEQHRWMLLAVCQAISKVSTTSGHFAQYLRVNRGNFGRYRAQRYRSVWREWLTAIDEQVPIGGSKWRSRNKVFHCDALTLLNQLKATKQGPAVIYADPPYTKDQYSRYYHVYETLLLYDYPTAVGKGRYRSDRFRSLFSLRSAVAPAMEALIQASAELGSDLVLSYPSEGLLPNTKKAVLCLLRKHYSKPEIARVIKHEHSSLGASKGAQKYQVDELIFVARSQ